MTLAERRKAAVAAIRNEKGHIIVMIEAMDNGGRRKQEGLIACFVDVEKKFKLAWAWKGDHPKCLDQHSRNRESEEGIL